MPYFIKAVGILFIILSQTSSLFSREFYVSKNVDFADQLIEKGATNTAYFILKEELKNNKYSTLDKYKITKLISRCFLKEMDFPHYDEYNIKAFQLVKDKEEIYKAQYYIERVYFFHHLTWSDSVIYYADKAHKVFYSNKKDWHKIEVPFFFQIYAIKNLYWDKYDFQYANDKLKTPLRWLKIFQYYDSALFYSKKFPYRKQSDLALLYRGIGNRHLDLVSGYSYPKTNVLKTISPLNIYCYRKAKDSYIKANSLLDSKNITEKISNYSLLGLLEMCVGNNNVSLKFFDTMHSVYDKNRDFFIPSTIYLTGLTYERMNDFNHQFSIKKTLKTIKILEGFVPKWLSHINSLESYSYDIYSYSPFYQLFCQYARLYFHTHNEYYAKKALVNLINEKLHFKKLNKNSNFDYYRRKSAFYEINRLHIKINKKFKIQKVIQNKPFTISDLNKIMNELSDVESVLFSFKSNDFLKEYKVLLTHKNIAFINSKDSTEFSEFDFEKSTITEFKKAAFKAYLNSLFRVLKFKNNLKKLYVLYDDDYPYERLLYRNNGNTYADLKYVINKTHIIKLYDFESYFLDPEITKKLNVKKILLANNLNTDLPFMYKFDPSQFCNCFNVIKVDQPILKNFSKDEVLHFVGHGRNAYTDSLGQLHQNQIIYSLFNKKLFSEKLDLTKQIQSPLIILNNCYSGARVGFNYVFDKGIYLQLMKKGARNVVASQSKIDDYVSSQLMKHFYIYLSKGIPVGEALIYAKRKFLRENKNGYANPMYWSPFFAISSRKVKF